MQKFDSEPERYFWFYVRFIVILSVAGVLTNINASLEIDEPFSANLVNLRWAEMLEVFLHDPAAPLYYASLKIWVSFFGDSEPAIRSLSTLYFVLTVVIVGFTAMKLDGIFSGVAGSVLAASSSIGVIFAGTARPYALLSLLTALSTLIFFYMVGLIKEHSVSNERKSFLLPAGFVATNVLSLLTHPIFIFFMLGYGLVSLGQPRQYFWKVALCLVLTTGIYIVIWGPFFLRTVSLPAISWMEFPDIKDLIHGYLNLWGVQSTVLLAFYIIFASIRNFQSTQDFLLSRSGLICMGIFLTASLFPFLVSQYRPVFDDSRTPALFFPLACVLVALLITRFKNLRLTFGLLTIMFGVVTVAPVFHRDDPETEKSARSSMEHVIDHARCGDIFISGGLSVNETSYYMRRLGAPDCIVHTVFPGSMNDHPGWMDPVGLLEHRHTLATEARLLVNELSEGLGPDNHVWFFYESDSDRQKVLDLLKDRLNRELVLVRTVDGYGTFFDRVLVYAAEK